MQPQTPDNTRNTIIFVVAMIALLLGYQFFVLRPQAERARAAAELAEKQATANTVGAVGRTPSAAPTAQTFVDRRQAAAASPRVPIATPSLQGSVSLDGSRIDDLFLTRYRETLDPDAPAVELFRPRGAENAYFAEFGWVGQNVAGLPDAGTRWTLARGDRLAVGRPIVLTYDTGAGLTFTRTIAVDDQYLFTVTDTVVNRTGRPVTLAPYASVQRHGVPPDLGKNQILHEGAVGVFDTDRDGEAYRLKELKYGRWRKDEQTFSADSDGGWLGVTDKYWLAALIPDQSERIDAKFRFIDGPQVDIHEAVFTGQPHVVPAGGQITETTRLFAGAKRQEILDTYGRQLGLPKFDSAIDWGNFWFLTRPIFATLAFFYNLVGNFGVAILLLTVAVKLVFFPLANQSYASMAKMKAVQPKVEELRKRHKDDPTKQQQEMLALYQKEKINPLAGCLPILVQIPVFYALFKVLSVTIEMRHAPFFGWIRDLSARDPTNVFNLFGLLPYDPGAIPLLGGLIGPTGALGIGVIALFYGFTMWLQQAMNPPPADPIQKQMFAFFPLIFTFVMAPFAVGLLIYWVWNNILSIAQQYVIMRRYGTDNPIDNVIGRFRGGETAKSRAG
jgi:YidC/Oxa1 family membrane protein insertase